MRYWVWLNDLVQGPFELEELVSLRAFSEELLVCMEDRTEWLPAGRVADLSPAIEQLQARRSQPIAPPPPPPSRAPALEPLQGEFFGDPPGQQPLLETDDGPQGPFAYRSPQLESIAPDAYLTGRPTSPFHFVQSPMSGGPAVLDVPRPVRSTPVYRFPPRRQESAVSVEEPVHTFPAPVLPPKVDLQVVQEALTASVAPPPVLPEPVTVPEPEAPPEPVAEPLPEPMVEESQSPVSRDFTLPTDERFASGRTLEWMPWIGAVLLGLLVLGSVGYWVMDRINTRSAIREADRLSPPAPVSMPPLAAPVAPGDAPPALKRPARPSRAAAIRKSVRKKTADLSTELQATVHKASHQAKKAAQQLPSIPKSLKRTTIKSVEKAPEAQEPQKTKATPALPGLAVEEDIPVMSEPAAPVLPPAPTPKGVVEPVSAPTPSPAAADPWAGRQNDAIKFVMGRRIPNTKVTIGSQASTMLEEMHEKELLHAAATGERLYLPDKIAWSALQESGSRYRVYLNFMAWQVTGERIQARSYQFVVDLKAKSVQPDDAATRQDILTDLVAARFKHNPMATDIESILGGVDAFNKFKVQLMIVKKKSANREGRKTIESGMLAAQNKVKRAVIFFRRNYNEQSLQNIAKAYNFQDLMK